MSLREGKLVNLACMEGHLVLASAHVRVWLSSWSCADVVACHGMMLHCRSWGHCWHGGGSPIVLCDVNLLWPSSSSHHGDSEGIGSLPWVVGRLASHGAGGLNPEL
jgi:hypothetical protein